MELDVDNRVKCAECWRLFLSLFSENMRGSKYTPMILAQFLERTYDININVRKEFEQAIKALDPFDTMFALETCCDLLQDSYMFEIMTMSSTTCATFGIRQFMILFCYLGMGALALQAEDTANIDMPLNAGMDWIPRIFHTHGYRHLLSLCNDQSKRDCLEKATFSLKSLSFWVFWEASRFCINNRLRTPFGGPMQFLAAIEKTFQQFLSNASQENTQGVEIFLSGLERIECLIAFTNILEKQISAAATGTFHYYEPPPKTAILFFSANLKVCREWFSRIRPLVLKCASLIDNEGLMLFNGFKYRKGQDNLENLQHLFVTVSALVKMKETDTLKGLANYWEQKGKYSDEKLCLDLAKFIFGASHFAECRFEDGIDLLTILISDKSLNSLLLDEIKRLVNIPKADGMQFHSYA
jgi:hypothetical protein